MSTDQLVLRLRAAGCVFAEDEARLLRASAADPAQLAAMVEQRLGGTPLEYLLGWAEFRGLRIHVEPGVFVPRRRTEFLAETALRFVRSDSIVVDLCCGAGAIAAALAASTGVATLHAVDIDPVAVRCAQRNVADAGTVYEGDLFDPLPAALRGTIDVVVANAPYVPTGEIDMMPTEARDHEHRVALDGGSDGLDVQRCIVTAAPTWLVGNGVLLIETSEAQAPHTAELIRAAGLTATTVADEDVAATVVVGQRATARP